MLLLKKFIGFFQERKLKRVPMREALRVPNYSGSYGTAGDCLEKEFENLQKKYSFSQTNIISMKYEEKVYSCSCNKKGENEEDKWEGEGRMVIVFWGIPPKRNK